MGERDVTVAAVMTAPRYECTQARTVIQKALTKTGIPLTVSGGVYYHQCMEKMLEDLCDQKIQYALTIDFDSVFLAEHITRLLSIVAQEDEIDALAAIQPMRNNGRVLGSLAEGGVMEWSGRPLQVDTAHFGLTVIDIQKLLTVRKPWFSFTPDEDGRWGTTSVDADVQFWRNWAEAGHKVFLDPGCRLGHLEEMVTVFDEKMIKQHLYYADWEKLSESTIN